MSTELGESDRTHKVVNLCRESQVASYKKAKQSIRMRADADLTEGEVVERLANTYLEFYGDAPMHAGVTELAAEHATDNGDPTFSKEQLGALDMVTLRNMASNANTDAVSGRSTKLELIGYFLAGP